jgi:hypothetical protein
VRAPVHLHVLPLSLFLQGSLLGWDDRTNSRKKGFPFHQASDQYEVSMS